MQVDSRDYVFLRASASSSSEALQEGRSEELMDKEVRAVFLCLFTYLLGDYQNYVTVIRFKPPSFYFNKVSMHASLYNTMVTGTFAELQFIHVFMSVIHTKILHTKI